MRSILSPRNKTPVSRSFFSNKMGFKANWLLLLFSTSWEGLQIDQQNHSNIKKLTICLWSLHQFNSRKSHDSRIILRSAPGNKRCAWVSPFFSREKHPVCLKGSAGICLNQTLSTYNGSISNRDNGKVPATIILIEIKSLETSSFHTGGTGTQPPTSNERKKNATVQSTRSAFFQFYAFVARMLRCFVGSE